MACGTLQSRQKNVSQYVLVKQMFCAFSVVKNNRKFSRGPGNPGHKGVVEADHMPPKDSLKKAAKEPLIWILGESEKYEGLLKMLQTKDPKGRNLFTLQVLTGQHRTALTTGNSRESVAVGYSLSFVLPSNSFRSPTDPLQINIKHTHSHSHPTPKPYKDKTIRLLHSCVTKNEYGN